MRCFIVTSYRQVLGRVQVDHQQGRRQAVIGQASVCAHASQHLIGRHGGRGHSAWRGGDGGVKGRTCSSFSGVDSRESHSSFRWSFPVDVSSRSNHCSVER